MNTLYWYLLTKDGIAINTHQNLLRFMLGELTAGNSRRRKLQLRLSCKR